MKEPNEKLLGQLTGLTTLAAGVALTASIALRLYKKIQQGLAEMQEQKALEAAPEEMPEEADDTPVEE